MTSDPGAWLSDPRLPPPGAADLAVHVAMQVRSPNPWRKCREATLRLATIALALDAARRAEADHAAELLGLVEQYAHAVRSSAHTSVVAIERLQQVDGLVRAARAWREQPDGIAAARLRDEIVGVERLIGGRS